MGFDGCVPRFDTFVGGLIFADRFLQLATKLSPDIDLYGFGQNYHLSFRHNLSHQQWYPLYSSYSVFNKVRVETNLCVQTNPILTFNR